MTNPKTLSELIEVKDSEWALDNKAFIKGEEKHIRQIARVRDMAFVEFAFSHERKFFPLDTPITHKHWKVI